MCCLFGDFPHIVTVLLSYPGPTRQIEWSSARVPGVEGAWAASSLTSGWVVCSLPCSRPASDTFSPGLVLMWLGGGGIFGAEMGV